MTTALIPNTDPWAELYTALDDVIAVNKQDGPLLERREILDSTARAIASWWVSAGFDENGTYAQMEALAGGHMVFVEELLEEIFRVRAHARLGLGSTDSVALDCLATWAINHPTRKEA